ncbi:MoaD/ThiS family protein [Caminibacter mediatlanticus]|uniref:Possible molybdopterin converting factor, subunit 1 n=1 Tax=Caminibacter mediatlanticus TB-2 TaxID=391592 RepID=A0AAI9AGT6_9BACT|nr:MoaD/ThiS family protein [Caminibacter mediatlanticus]EDM23367.1 possible molybdopterin converting factor, subunit 1 [Caminibacter mediatlanticus TB-2]
MVIVEFLGPINKDKIEVEVKNLEELKEVLNKDEKLRPWLKTSAVAVNDKIVTKNVELKNGDKVSILPPVCGG